VPTADAYGRIAGVYSAILDPLNRALRRSAMRMYQAEAGWRVLDVGCGTGAALAEYAAAGCVVSGIDSSEAMLAKARALLGEDSDLRLGDAADLPYENESFDLVLASLVLHEMPADDRRAVLAEMARVVKPGGAAIVVELGPGPYVGLGGKARRLVTVALERAAGTDHYANQVTFLEQGGLPGAVRDTGLALRDERTVSGGNIGMYTLTRS